MSQEKIIVTAQVDAPIAKVWTAYTDPAHVTGWNFASEDWCCPRAQGDLRIGGRFIHRMEARDGSMGFDFEGIYTEIEPHKRLAYAFGDRQADVTFTPDGDGVLVRVAFDPENEFPLDQQEAGWQAILDNFARYARGI